MLQSKMEKEGFLIVLVWHSLFQHSTTDTLCFAVAAPLSWMKYTNLNPNLTNGGIYGSVDLYNVVEIVLIPIRKVNCSPFDSDTSC